MCRLLLVIKVSFLEPDEFAVQRAVGFQRSFSSGLRSNGNALARRPFQSSGQELKGGFNLGEFCHSDIKHAEVVQVATSIRLVRFRSSR